MASSNSLSEQVKSLKKKDQNPEVARNVASLKTQIAEKCKEIRIDFKLEPNKNIITWKSWNEGFLMTVHQNFFKS